MRYHALATDYDGTLAREGQVDPFAIRTLETFRESGRRLLLVTGRRIEELLTVFGRTDLFDCVVGENGALLYWPESGRTELLAPPPPEPFVALLRARAVEPLALGRAIVATLTVREPQVAEAIRETGADMEIILNKESLMVLPRGTDKASGLAAALDALKLEAGTVAGIGDAENDLAFIKRCGCAAAVANALPQLKAQADLVTEAGFGHGVAELAQRLMRMG